MPASAASSSSGSGSGSASSPAGPSAAGDEQQQQRRPAALFAPLLAGRMPSQDEIDNWVSEHRTVVTAGTASLVSTVASFPFDSLKSRLQVKYYPSIWACGRAVLEEEGIAGFFRGVTIPLITITFVRTSSFSIYYNTKNALHERGYVADASKLSNIALSGAAGGFTSGLVISCGSAPFELVKVQRQLEYLIAVQKGLAGSSRSNGSGNTGSGGGSGSGSGARPGPAAQATAAAGSTASSAQSSTTGGARTVATASPSSTASVASPASSSTSQSSPGSSGSVATVRSTSTATATRYVPQSGFHAAREIMTNHGGIRGFYIGFRLHFLRDTSGTAIYFGLYDTLREIVRRQTGGAAHEGSRLSPSSSASPLSSKSNTAASSSHPPRIFGMPAPPAPVLQFLTGSTAGILSWLAVYWIDFLKTNVQQRRLAGGDARITAWQVLTEEKELGVVKRIARLYRGIGISAVRSFISHGLTWTLIEQISERIDARERLRGTQGTSSASTLSAGSLATSDASSSSSTSTSSRWR